MSDDCGHDGEPRFVTAEELQRLQELAMEGHRIHHEEYALAVRALCHESDEEHLRTVLRVLSSIADAGDSRAMANYFQGLVAGALGARDWARDQAAAVTVPEEFGSVAEERFGRHVFVPAFAGSEVCSTCGTPPANAAHRGEA